MIIIGWNPTPLLERMEPSVRVVIERVEEAGARAAAIEVLDAIPPAQVAQTDDPEDMNDGSAPAVAGGHE